MLFYKRIHYLALAILLLTIIINIALITVIALLVKRPFEPLYFAADNIGRLMTIIPVDRPNMSNEQILEWATNAVTSAYSYNYINYRSQLQDTQKYFTPYGWSKYLATLTASNNLVALNQRRMIFMAKAVSKPKIITEGILSGAYAWKIEMLLLVTYWLPPYDANSKFSNPMTVSMIVQRQTELKGYQGLGIVQLIANMAAITPAQPQVITTPPPQ